MNSLFRFEIPKRNACCSHDGERLLGGTTIYSILYETAEEKLKREDFCSHCWVKQEKIQKPSVIRAAWQSIIEKKDPKPISGRIEQVLQLLREYLSSPDEFEAEIFVLCLYLAHGRHLALRQEIKNETGRYYLYEFLKTEEYVTVQVIHLSLDQIACIQKKLASRLNSATSLK